MRGHLLSNTNVKFCISVQNNVQICILAHDSSFLWFSIYVHVMNCFKVFVNHRSKVSSAQSMKGILICQSMTSKNMSVYVDFQLAIMLMLIVVLKAVCLPQ